MSIDNNNEKIIQLEKYILQIPEYEKLYHAKKDALSVLKNKSIDLSWEEYDDFLCADNALYFFIMSYFYNKGFMDGINK